jgi:hypothetical protein
MNAANAIERGDTDDLGSTVLKGHIKGIRILNLGARIHQPITFQRWRRGK